ncbi:HD family phosphohydrolase [Halonatronum saccharophilum]|uniref:HD family phosphohydrolase n=1 Tax=Halonatronum saccharophilum TaxID=150060 RepID=UPI000488DDD8|nr:HDIG domain-containing metalloprotein [Halonatronum saccharophilum]
MPFFKSLLDKFNFNDLEFYKIKKSQRYLWVITVFIILAGIITLDFLPNQVDLTVGQVSKTDIVAPRTVTYTDQKRTEELKAEAEDQVSKVYEEDRGVLEEVKVSLRDFFDGIEGVVEAENLFSEEVAKLEELARGYEVDIDNEQIEYLLNLSSSKRDELLDDTQIILIKYLNRGVRSDAIDEVKEQFEQEVINLNKGHRYRDMVSSLSKEFIEPNLIFNFEETERRKELARQEVESVKRTIHKDEVVIRHGRVITEEDVRILEALGLRHPTVNYFNILGHVLIVLMFILLTTVYIYRYQKDILDEEGILALLGLLPIVILLLAKIANYIPITYNSFIVPVAAVSIIITILINTNLAVVYTIFLSFLVALATGDGVISIAVLIVSGLTGIYSVSKLTQRSDLVKAGFIVGGVSSLTIFIFMLTEPYLQIIEFVRVVPMGIVNGIIVAVVTNGLLPYVENLFGITSPVKLLELSNPNHPLLKRLLVEAPGTYHHSIIVGNLAETAADQVGADSLLARVAAYYHDVGKIKRSYFFTENQIGYENPHDKLSPNLSTLIITSHIKDGVELAKEYKLPQVIVDIIIQHHGTSLVSFFYQEALHDEQYKNVEEDDFRYDGPKPQTKEAALIMLADMVEAAVRSNASAQRNPGKLEKFVKDLIKSKLDSGELDESDLTLKDLNKIGNAFVNILKGIFHNRIEYPENIAQQFKEGSKLNDSTGK